MAKAPQSQQAPATQEVRVTRAFYYEGKPLKIGSTTELPRIFALEMKAANKVEFVEPKPEGSTATPPAKS